MGNKGNQRDKRRQKKLQRHKQKQKSIRQAVGEKLAVGLNSELPLYGCWVDDGRRGDQLQGLATVAIARRMGAGKVQYALFLVDRLALGVKDCFGAVGVPSGAIDARIAYLQEQDDGHMREAELLFAQQLIWGGVEYALKVGFAPHPDFARWQAIVGALPAGAEILDDLFGLDGQPLFMGEIHDLARRRLAAYDAESLDIESYCARQIEPEWFTEADDRDERRLRATNRLFALLPAFAAVRPFNLCLEDALNRFAEDAEDEVDLETLLSSPEGLAFMDWFIHDYLLPDGRTVVDHFAARIGPHLPQVERDLVTSWQASTISTWQVNRVDPGEGLELADLLLGGTRYVRDVALSQSAKRWGIFVARLLPVSSFYAYSGGSYQMPPDYAGIFARTMEEWEDDAAETGDDATRTDLLKANGFLLYVLQRDLVAELDAPALLTPEGDPFELAFAVYRGRHAELVAALSAESELEPDAAAEPGDEPAAVAEQFVWWEADDDLGRHPIARFTVRGDRVLITSMNRMRLIGARALLERAAGPQVVFVQEAVLDPTAVPAAGSIRAALAAYPEIAALIDEPPRSADAIDPETRRQLEGDFLAQHYRDWPDQALPALEGRTPRAAVQTEAGRYQVELLLRSFEFRGSFRDDGGGLDVNQLRRELGLLDP